MDQWLADQHHKLVSDVVAALDVEAGMREVLIPTHHADMVADLDWSLDVEAGLASIVPIAPDATPPTEPRASNTQPVDVEPVTTSSADQAAADQKAPDVVLDKLAQVAPSWSPSTRLAMRTDPIFSCLARDLDLDLDLDRALVLDLARHLALDLARALVLDLDRVLALARDLDRTRARTIRALAHLHYVLSDLTGVDLRSVDLTGVPLEGLRWSDETRWPPEWEDRIRQDSVEVAEGIFEVSRGGTTYAHTGV